MAVFVLGGAFYLKRSALSHSGVATITIESQKPSPAPQYSSADETANWKTFTLDKITFKYPPNWDSPKYINNGPGPMAAINKNGEKSQQITVIGGGNKGYSEQKLSDWINSNASGPGNKKLTLDGSEAAEGYVRFQGVIATIGVYVTAQDKKSQYQISIDNPEKLSDQEMDKLMDQILSTFKFLD